MSDNGRTSTTETSAPRHGDAAPAGDRNRNPRDLGLLALIREDFRTHGNKPLEPGFAALLVHRLANARWDLRSKAARLPVTALCRLGYTWVDLVLGIEIPYSTQVGRRVRIWHHGGIVLGARAIGDDVQIRQNTTFGVLHMGDEGGVPIIGNRVELGAGACVAGPVTVGDDSVVGPNSLVIRDLPPKSVVMGVPARQATLKVEAQGNGGAAAKASASSQ
ncbi:MAG: transferase [Deltaproteobacteria bacterium]|nr:transferase [Deltaproteobacteria bacterium]